VIATLGVLLAGIRPHWSLLVIPVAWCVISGLTLLTLESPEAPLVPSLAAFALATTLWKALAHRGKTR
jgi:hypothetical protein